MGMTNPTAASTTASRSDTVTDRELLHEARRSSAAFRVVYDRHAQRIHGFLLRRTRDPDAAFELTAETFAQAWLSRERFVDPAEATAAPWLFGIARHVLASSVRRQALERRASDRLALAHRANGSASPIVDRAWLDGVDNDLAAALAELPDGQRRAIELRFLADQAYDEVARQLEITPQAARVRVHRGLAAVRRHLSRASPRDTAADDDSSPIPTDQPEGARP
jgi:RNA polymerase sigma-70 factor (ECF subfamily)